MQEIRNSIALAMELRLSCTNPSICNIFWNCWCWWCPFLSFQPPLKPSKPVEFHPNNITPQSGETIAVYIPMTSIKTKWPRPVGHQMTLNLQCLLDKAGSGQRRHLAHVIRALAITTTRIGRPIGAKVTRPWARTTGVALLPEVT